jgi:gas vesicle protein
MIFLIVKNITRIRENREANADLIRKQNERIEKDIRYLREAMNNHLDKLQERLRREFMEVEVKTNMIFLIVFLTSLLNTTVRN